MHTAILYSNFSQDNILSQSSLCNACRKISLLQAMAAEDFNDQQQYLDSIDYQ